MTQTDTDKIKAWLEDTVMRNFDNMKEKIMEEDWKVDLGEPFGYSAGFKVPMGDSGWNLIYTGSINIKKDDNS